MEETKTLKLNKKRRLSFSGLGALALSIVLMAFGVVITYYAISAFMLGFDIKMNLFDRVMLLKNMNWYALPIEIFGAAIFVTVVLKSKLKPDVSKIKRQFLKASTIFMAFIIIFSSAAAFTPVVMAEGVATSDYFLQTPLPIATVYVGQYDNNTYFYISGTNWQNMGRDSNLTKICEDATNSITSGVVWCGGVRWNYNITIPDGVTIHESYGGGYPDRTFANPSKSTSPYTISVDNVVTDPVTYLAQDASGTICWSSTNKSSVENSVITALTLTGGTIVLNEITWDTTITIPENILVIQQYQGNTLYFSHDYPLGSVPITGPVTYASSMIQSNGMFAWHQGQQAVFYNNATYYSWVASKNTVGMWGLSCYNHTTGTTTTYTLGTDVTGADDHNTPVILVREPDHKIVVFYCGHSANPMYWQISANAEDITSWGTTQNFTSGAGPTYPSAVQLTGEDNRIYVFYRTIIDTYRWAYRTSDDNGASFEDEIILENAFVNARPYTQVATNGVDRIDFMVNDANGGNGPSEDIMHFYYEAGSFYQTDGTLITNVAGLPITSKAQLTMVYNSTDGYDCKGWDITYQNSVPYIAFSVFRDLTTDHRYVWAKWTGTQWQISDVDSAGITPYLLTTDVLPYDGGVRIDPAEPNTVYYSANTGVNRWDMFKATTFDDAMTWNITKLTSSGKNIHPVSVFNGKDFFRVMWSEGIYVSITGFRTNVWAYPTEAYVYTPYADNVLGASSTSDANVYPFQRHALFINDRYWAFYSDGDFIYYSTSLNGINWLVPQPIRGADRGYQFDVSFDGTYLKYVCSGTHRLYYRAGVPTDSGIISWATDEETILLTGASFPVVTTDSNGYTWIGCVNGSSTSTSTPIVYKSSVNNGSFILAGDGFPYVLNATASSFKLSIVTLPNNAVTAVYADTTQTYLHSWNTTWGDPVAAGVKPVAGAYISVTTQGNDLVHVGLLQASTTNLIDVLYRYSTNTVVAINTIEAATTATSAPQLSMDESSNTLYCFWAESNTIYYRASKSGIWSSAVTFVNEATLTIPYNRGLSAPAISDGKVFCEYLAGSSDPYTMKAKPIG